MDFFLGCRVNTDQMDAIYLSVYLSVSDKHILTCNNTQNSLLLIPHHDYRNQNKPRKKHLFFYFLQGKVEG